ncbi:hypothetical protein [Bradyrhizobium elkanii]|uniref:hypothetical protein n=1 Tax=Bradyrhizobium elkanii TaxID=29448 RepID=UPI00384C5EDC
MYVAIDGYKQCRYRGSGGAIPQSGRFRFATHCFANRNEYDYRRDEDHGECELQIQSDAAGMERGHQSRRSEYSAWLLRTSGAVQLRRAAIRLKRRQMVLLGQSHLLCGESEQSRQGNRAAPGVFARIPFWGDPIRWV